MNHAESTMKKLKAAKAAAPPPRRNVQTIEVYLGHVDVDVDLAKIATEDLREELSLRVFDREGPHDDETRIELERIYQLFACGRAAEASVEAHRWIAQAINRLALA